MTDDTRSTRREVLAEFLATFILLLIGLGVVAQVVLSRQAFGTLLSINLAWGIGVAIGCYIAGGVSGAHMNPAVTIALAVHRGLPWGRVVPYVTAQSLGAFAASAVIYVTYHEALEAFDGGVRQIAGAQGTAGIWATYPQPFLSTFPGGFLDQFVGTAVLMCAILAIADARNSPPPTGLAPLIVGLVVAAIGMSFAFNAGYAINPARDFAPRLFTALAGWGSGVFRAGNAYWWVPIAGPIAGAVAGGWLYDALVGNRFPGDESPMSAASHHPVPQPGQLPPD